MAARFWVGGTGTWDSSTTTHWSASTGGAGGASAPTSSDAVTIDGSSGAGTITVDFSGFASNTGIFLGLTCGAMGMTLDFSVNNHNITLTSSTGFNPSGTGTRTIKLGNGNWTLTSNAAATIFNFTTTTGLTFAANSSTIIYNPGVGTALGTFSGAQTYNNVTISSGTMTFSGANTFATLAVSGGATLILTSTITQTVTGLTISGGASSAAGILSNSATAVGTISKTTGTVTLNGVGLRGVTFSGGATFAANNAYDLGNNTGITITAPSGGGAGVVGVIGS